MIRPPHRRTGVRTRRGRLGRSRRCIEAVREGLAAGLGWHVRKAATASRRGRRGMPRRTGGLWGYRRHAWETKLKIQRWFAAGPSDVEVAERLGQALRNLARLRQAAHEEALLDECLDRPAGRGGVPRGLLDPAAGGRRGGPPEDWEPFEW